MLAGIGATTLDTAGSMVATGAAQEATVAKDQDSSAGANHAQATKDQNASDPVRAPKERGKMLTVARFTAFCDDSWARKNIFKY